MVTINIGRKEAVFFGVFVFVLIISGLTIAFGGNVPSDMGHSVGELAAPAGCSSGHSLVWNGASWECGLGAAGEDRVFVGSFGDWETTNGGQDLCGGAACTNAAFASDVVYRAATDGIVSAVGTGGGTVPRNGYTDSVDASDLRTSGNYPNPGNPDGLTMPVKKGDYWQVTGVSDINWMPIESGGTSTANHVSDNVKTNAISSTPLIAVQQTVSLSKSSADTLIFFNVNVGNAGGDNDGGRFRVSLYNGNSVIWSGDKSQLKYNADGFVNAVHHETLSDGDVLYLKVTELSGGLALKNNVNEAEITVLEL